MKKEELRSLINQRIADWNDGHVQTKHIDLERQVGELEEVVTGVHNGLEDIDEKVCESAAKINELCEFEKRLQSIVKHHHRNLIGIDYPEPVKPLDTEPDDSEKKYLCMQCAKELGLPTHQPDKPKIDYKSILKAKYDPDNSKDEDKEQDEYVKLHGDMSEAWENGYMQGRENMIDEVIGLIPENALYCEWLHKELKSMLDNNS